MKLKYAVKIGLLGVVSMFSASSFATESLALQTVKQMYDLAKRYEKGMEVVSLFADESLTQAFNRQSFDEGICGYDYDLLWQSQDPEYQRKINFTAVGFNQVRVDLGKGEWHKASSVGYKMNCQNGTCKVNDVIDEFGSLKARIYAQCKANH